MTDGRMLVAGDVALDTVITPDVPVVTPPSVAGTLTLAAAQAEMAQQLQALSELRHAGNSTFSGPVQDQKVLTGQNYSYVLPAALFADLGANVTYSVSLANGDPLPTWLTFNAATRTLTGSPTNGQLGQWVLNIVATLTASAVAQKIQTYTLSSRIYALNNLTHKVSKPVSINLKNAWLKYNPLIAKSWMQSGLRRLQIIKNLSKIGLNKLIKIAF